MSPSADDIGSAVQRRAADARSPGGATAVVPPPWVNTTAYRVFASLVAVAGVASLVALVLDAPWYIAVTTSLLYVLGVGLLLLGVPLVHSRVVRLLGTPVGEIPESLLTVPLLVVAPHWAYVLAVLWVTLSACLRLRVRWLDTVFNLGGAAVSSVAASVVLHLVTSPRGGVGVRVVVGTVAAVLLSYAITECLVWLGCVLDGKRQHAPTPVSSLVRLAPQLTSVGLALCSVTLAANGSVLGALLGHALLVIVLSHVTAQGRAANQRWLAEQLYISSERIRSQTHPDDVPTALGQELATLWQAHRWTVTDHPSRGDESYWLGPDCYVTVVPGRAVATTLTRQAATSLVNTAVQARRALEFEDELKQRATRDALTGLGNRHRLWETLDEQLPAAGRGAPLVVMSLDLDSFKAINDTYGHAVGDQLLVAVAERLLEQTGTGDVVCRIASDEFVLVGPGEQGVGEALRRAHRVQQALSVPFTLDQSVINVTCSVGVHFIDQATTRTTALTSADAALMRAKRSGRGTVTLATTEVVLQARRLLRLDAELRAAMHQGEFTLHYQPMVDAVRGEAFAVEALLRWERDGVVQMGPDDFIPYAEESGLISTIGLWVLRRACEQVHAWNQQHRLDHPLRVSVNISTVHIAQPTFVEDVQQILLDTGLAPELLILEVTETFATLDLAASVATGRALREIGVSLWLDDFGTGYSSLEYLRQLPVEVVKLDRSFLTDIVSDASARGFIESIVHLCRSIGREPLAEGVEVPEQRSILVDLGCPAMQGYLFARPLPLDQLAPTLAPSTAGPRGPVA
ncbi:putative bifunctional diguanylate cyclase/phosphodiesterase [Arsenicicoccus sp. oral taxon 190]|uniref:putative bifunctional diguanylate cyclase/phosphodiesterase n=1 Tax=Arsenicicoccus sp. oral taxon 190 TaxID=1658671 RepID=UPI00067E1C70|nr:bifunctional diguanylate cyclase/phosphodiesterase [Arsenicicoccus sp. oral taxon 190]